MPFSALSSDHVKTFLPPSTWTEVILLSTTPTDDDIYICSTEEKLNERRKYMEGISCDSVKFEKIDKFKSSKLVAIKIDGKWKRGKLINFNEFLTDNIRVELIDDGSFIQTTLQNVFALPYFYAHNSLVLPIKFKNYIPKTTKLIVQPLFSESLLYDGFVFVDVKLANIQNEMQQSGEKKELLAINGFNNVDVQNITNDLNAVNTQISNNGCSDNDVLSVRKSGFHYDQPKVKSMPFKSGDYCFITHFDHFTSIYVCQAEKNEATENYKQSDHDIMKKTAYITDEIPKCFPVVGDIVKVLSPQFGIQFRAKILKKTKNGNYDVFYIDFGNIENVPSDAVFEIPEELKFYPGIAVKVGMSDLKHIPCTEKVKDKFEDLSYKLLIIEFNEVAENCLENVALKDIKNGIYIHNMFSSITSDFKTTVQNSKKLNDFKSNIAVVFIKYFEDMDNVYILKNVQLFNDTMLKVDGENCKSKKDFNVGEIVKVVSKCNVYRGRIQKIEANLINVINIDFGYCDVVQSDCIYELSDYLQKIPQLVSKIRIKEPFLEKTEDLVQYVKNIEKVPLYLEYDDNKSDGCQKTILKRCDNSENIFDAFIKTINNPLTSNDISIKSPNNNIIKAKKSSDNEFQSITLKNGDYCLVSHFENFKNIYLCLAVKNCTSDVYEIHNLDIIIKTMKSEDRKIKKHLIVGDLVKVFSPFFKDLFRAKIIDIIDNTKFHVSYIDFGNLEIVQSSDIFELSEELKIKTKLPIRVSIDVPPTAKKTNEIENIFKRLSDNNVVLSIEYKTNSVGLENVLLKELESGNYVNDQVLKLLPIENKVSIKNGDKCILTHFENFDSIYVYNMSKKENCQILNDTSLNTDCIIKTNLAVGDITKVFSPSFQHLCRAQIVKIVDSKNIHVFYIDFGNTEVVQTINIFELSDNLKKNPGIAIKVGIKIPNHVKMNEEIEKMFLNLAEGGEQLSIEFDESSETGLQNSILKVISSGVDLKNEVIKLLSNPVSSIKTEDQIKSQNVNAKVLKNGEMVTFRYFHDSTSVFIWPRSEEDSNLFEYVMVQTNEQEMIKMSDIKIGNIVMSLFEGYMYRAKILNQVDQNHFCISFIDFGNNEIVHVNTIFELSDNLKKIQGLCMKIGIRGLPKIEKTTAVKNYFDGLENEPLFIEFDEDDPNGLCETRLKKKNNSDVFDELLKIIDHSVNIKPIPKPQNITETVINKEIVMENPFESEVISSIELNSGDIVFCCHFEDFNNMYLCKSSTDNVGPENFKVIIDFSKVADITPKTNIKRGDMVRVKFENKLFRANVLTKSGEAYTAFLIDIGRKIEVIATDIYAIPDNLKKIPGLAKKVGLQGVTDLKITKSIKDYFYCLWNTEQIPLILIYNEKNFNYINEVTLKKQSTGCDIIHDLLKINSLNNIIQINKIKSIEQNLNMNGSTTNWYIISGDHVEFLHGNNVENIYVKSLRLNEEFKNIIEQLKEEKIDNLKLVSPNYNDIVAVYSSKHRGVYRAKILSSEESGKFKCRLFDIGLIDIIQSQHIFVLPDKFTPNKIPFLVHKVELNGLAKINCNNAQISSYLSSMNGKIFIVEFDKNTEHWNKQVVLKELKTSKSMNEEIKKLVSNKPQTNIQQRLEKKIFIIENKENEVKKISHPIKSGSSVNIVHFEDFNSIFVRVVSYESFGKFDKLCKQMLKCYRNVKTTYCTKKLLNIGDKVCVQSTLNSVMFCRALITNKFNDEYNVFYVDYGNTEMVTSEDIFELSQELREIEDFAIQVQIQNMPLMLGKNANQIVKDYIRKKFIITNAILIIEFNESNPKGLKDVILKTEFYKRDITDDLKNLLNDPPLNIKTTGYNQSIQDNTEIQTSSPYPGRRFFNKSLK